MMLKPATSPFRDLSWRDLAWALALAVITGIVYAPVTQYEFVNFDDYTYVSMNPHVLGGLTLSNASWALTTRDCANWHPATWWSLQFDGSIWGGDATGYHLTNLLLHSANTGLVYIVLVALTGSVGRSLLVAALFGCHPLHVESVAWVAERKDVLFVFFGLLAILAYVQYFRRLTWGRFVPVIVLFALSLMAKPMLVTLPCVLLLLDAWPLGRMKTGDQFAELVKEKWPLFVLAGLSCLVTIYVQMWGGAVRGLHESSLSVRLSGVGVSYCIYISKTFVPQGLAVFYPMPAERPEWQGLTAVVGLLCITALAIVLRRRVPAFLVGWLWFLGTCVPVIGLLHVGDAAYADRYTYWPHIGLFLALVWLASAIADGIRLPHWLRWGIGVALIVACIILARQQMTYWENSLSLWARAAEVTPYSVYIDLMVARTLFVRGEHDESIKWFDRALAIEPENTEVHIFRARAMSLLGRE